jgi:hypothetical protein
VKARSWHSAPACIVPLLANTSLIDRKRDERRRRASCTPTASTSQALPLSFELSISPSKTMDLSYRVGQETNQQLMIRCPVQRAQHIIVLLLLPLHIVGASVFAAFWTSTGLMFMACFAEEGLFIATLCGVMALLFVLPARTLGLHIVGIIAVPIAVLTPLAMIAPPPSTHPGARAQLDATISSPPVLRTGHLVMTVDPTLSVDDSSRTGFQTLFGPGPLPISSTSTSRQRGDLRVIEGHSTLTAPIYAHLSTYSSLLITGYDNLQVVFSPCPKITFPVEPADCPWGAPRKLAYVTEDRRFVVAIARTAEKGPFTTLCEGQLDAHQPLTLTFKDGDEPIVAVTWLDYAAQLSTDLSPAAGYSLHRTRWSSVNPALAAAPSYT